jgi:hypothetical protein
MGKLICFTPAPLDGYLADDGNFNWPAPIRALPGYVRIRLDLLVYLRYQAQAF